MRCGDIDPQLDSYNLQPPLPLDVDIVIAEMYHL